MQDGKLHSVNQARANFYLSNDVFSYACNEGYMFHKGSSDDYIYKCLEDGSYNNTDVPICITSSKIKYFNLS